MNIQEGEVSGITEVMHYLEMGRIRTAMARLKGMLADSPNNGHYLYVLAVCHLNLDQVTEAKSCCLEAMAQGYDKADCLYLLGKIAMDSRDYPEAERLFLDTLAIEPQNAEIIACYGYLMFKTGYRKKAKQLLAEALRLEPYDETVLYYNFLVHLAENNRLEQQRTLRQYIHSADNEVNKLVVIGLADYFRQDYRSAKENFRQAFLLEPSNSSILEMLQDMEWRTNIFVRPVTWLEKIGGAAAVWIFFVAAIGGLMFFKMFKMAVAVALVYIAFCIYTWIIAVIEKFYRQRKS